MEKTDRAGPNCSLGLPAGTDETFSPPIGGFHLSGPEEELGPGESRFRSMLMALRQSEDRYRRIVEIAGEGIWIVDAENRTVFVNQRMAEMIGYTVEELVGRSFGTFVDDDRREVMEEKYRAQRKGVREQYDFRLRHKDGSYRWVMVSATPFFDQRDRYAGALAVMVDITHRRRAEEALRLNDARLEALWNLSQMTERPLEAISEFALEEAVRLTRSTIGFLGFIDDQETAMDVLAWSKTAMAACAIRDKPMQFSIAESGLWGEVVRQREPVLVNDYDGLAKWKKGYPEGHVQIHRYLGIPVFDGDRIVAVAAVANKEGNYDGADVRQVTLLMDGLWRLIQRRKAAEALQRAHDELEEQVDQRTAALKAANRELRHEIAQRVAAEEALRKEKERYRTLVETLPHGIEEIDVEGVRTFVSGAFHRIHGYPQGALVGTHIWDTVAPESEQDRVREYFRFLLAEQPEPAPLFTRLRTKSGGRVEFRLDWDYKRDPSGEIAGFVAVLTDITEQRRAEEEAQRQLDALAHVERLATMGEMVSGLAHELNQPLAAIANYAQACRHTVRAFQGNNSGEVLESVEQIAEQAIRAGEIIRRLREFVRRAESRRSTADLNELVREVVVLMEVEMRLHDVRLELALAGSLPPVHVDRIQVEQVITNLLHNALEATQESPRDQRAVTVRTSLCTAELLEVAVEDNGRGLRIEEIDRLFEPFYTTKAEGMGLGLSISRSIIEAHGGVLEAAPNADQGTTFRFTLPVLLEGGAR